MTDKDSHESFFEEYVETVIALVLSDVVSDVSEVDYDHSSVGDAPIEDSTEVRTESKCEDALVTWSWFYLYEPETHPDTRLRDIV